MIKHHPTQDILQQFAAGDLSASLSIAVAIHVEMCPECQKQIASMTAKQADSCLRDDTQFHDSDELDELFASITDDESIDTFTYASPEVIHAGNSQFELPSALRSLKLGDWSGFGKVNRSRVELADGDIRSSVLHIEPGGEIPHHTHNGTEVTVMLDGSFCDELGEYHRGDFIWLDGNHKHNPVSQEGCVCYAVVSDALHFSHGLSRLLNPIGRLIY
jgi:putative transcriptional regulator